MWVFNKKHRKTDFTSIETFNPKVLCNYCNGFKTDIEFSFQMKWNFEERF